MKCYLSNFESKTKKFAERYETFWLIQNGVFEFEMFSVFAVLGIIQWPDDD